MTQRVEKNQPIRKFRTHIIWYSFENPTQHTRAAIVAWEPPDTASTRIRKSDGSGKKSRSIKHFKIEPLIGQTEGWDQSYLNQRRILARSLRECRTANIKKAY